MNSSDVLFYTVFALLVPINALIAWLIMKRALVKHIRPALQKQGFELIAYKWAGLFSTGDFERKSSFVAVQSPQFSIYIYLFIKYGDNQQRITARVDTLFFFVRKVVYSAVITS